MNATLHLTDDIDSNALLMGIMFTAIQTNNQILRETLCQLLRDEGADKKLDYHRALKGAFYVFTRAKRKSYTVV